MTITYPSSNAVDLMTAISAGLPGAAIEIKNSVNGTVFPTSATASLSSSPSYQLADGTIVVRGSSAGFYYNGNTGSINGGTISFGGMTGIPTVKGPVAVLVASTDHNIYFVGAVVPPPLGGTEGDY